MKCILSTLLILCSFVSLKAQELQDKKVTLIQFSYVSESSVLNGLDKYEPATKREKERFAKVRNQLKVDVQNFFFDEFKKNMEEAGITMEPANSLENVGIMYTNGLPQVLTLKSGVKKVQKKGHKSDYYVGVTMTNFIDSGLMSSSTKIINKFVAEVEVVIHIVGTDGKKIKTIKHKTSSPEKIDNKAYFGGRFDKTDTEDLERLKEILNPLIAIATKKAVEQL